MAKRSLEDKLEEALRYVPDPRGYKQLEEVIEAGADVNTFRKGLDGPPLRYSVRRRGRSAKMLLEAGADPEESRLAPWDRYKPLYIAAGNADIEKVDLLLSFNADPSGTFEAAGGTSLMAAARSQPTPIVTRRCKPENPMVVLQRLIEAGVDANIMDHQGKTALDHCVEMGRRLMTREQLFVQKQMVELLKQVTTEPWSPNYIELAPPNRRAIFICGYAWKGEAEKLSNALKRYGDDLSKMDLHSILVAASSGHIDIVQMMLEAGAPVNANNDDEDYITPVSQAARCGDDAIVKLLLEAGADPTIKSGFPKRDALDWWREGDGGTGILAMLEPGRPKQK